jgi:hypothetical protein
MRRSLWVAAVFILIAPGFAAQADEGMESTLKARAIASAAAAAAVSPPPLTQAAPFLQNRDPFTGLLLRDDPQRRVDRGTCQHSTKDLCYDLADRRIVYRPARQYLPRIEGLKAEGVSLRRDKLVVKYSFR